MDIVDTRSEAHTLNSVGKFSKSHWKAYKVPTLFFPSSYQQRSAFHNAHASAEQLAWFFCVLLCCLESPVRSWALSDTLQTVMRATK